MITKVLYLCDRKRCFKDAIQQQIDYRFNPCGECSHTSDIEHSNWDHEPTQEELDIKFRRHESGKDTLYFEIGT